MADVTRTVADCFFVILKKKKTFYNVFNNNDDDDEDDIPKEIVFCFDTNAVICFLPINLHDAKVELLWI